MAQMIKNPPVMQETWVRSLGWEDALQKGKATHSSLENSMDCVVHGGHKESDTTEQLSLSLFTISPNQGKLINWGMSQSNFHAL